MNPPDQDSLESSLLCILYEKSNGRNHFESATQLATLFRPPITQERVKIGLRSLAERGLAIRDADLPGGYEISREGIDWVEDEFAISFSEPNFTFQRRRNPGSLPEPKTAKETDWSESGARATWIGVFVAIGIGAVTIAIMKGWL
ncbi:hypothetical protein PF049_08685 [Erythrobacteraceae bacterium WH01K]|nr:hypothetical protein PF049_08685 [Erythrobacteraceae bacterium WH01K]